MRSAAGLHLADGDALIAEFTRELNRGRNTGPQGAPIASTTWEYPDARRLSYDDSAGNASKVEAVTGLQALTASGGICGPLNIDYSLMTLPVADRPVRDALPAFNADRGGVRFISPAKLTDAAGAVDVWTAATDANPGGVTKPRQVVTCGTEQVVTVDALTGCGCWSATFRPGSHPSRCRSD